MASSLALNNFPGFSKEAIPQDWFPRGEEVTCQIGSYLLALPKCLSHDWVKSQVSTGTTLVAVEFEGGVVIGADSRTSMVRIPWVSLEQFKPWLFRALGLPTGWLTNSPQSLTTFSAAGAVKLYFLSFELFNLFCFFRSGSAADTQAITDIVK